MYEPWRNAARVDRAAPTSTTWPARASRRMSVGDARFPTRWCCSTSTAPCSTARRTCSPRSTACAPRAGAAPMHAGRAAPARVEGRARDARRGVSRHRRRTSANAWMPGIPRRLRAANSAGTARCSTASRRCCARSKPPARAGASSPTSPNTWRAQLMPMLGWETRCAVLIGGDTLPERKPDPLPLLHRGRAHGRRAAPTASTSATTSATSRPRARPACRRSSRCGAIAWTRTTRWPGAAT